MFYVLRVGQGTECSMLFFFLPRKFSPLRPTPTPDPPLPIRRGEASTPAPLLLRHGTPAPCDSSLWSESHRRREETREILIHNNGATCSLRSISVRSSLHSATLAPCP